MFDIELGGVMEYALTSSARALGMSLCDFVGAALIDKINAVPAKGLGAAPPETRKTLEEIRRPKMDLEEAIMAAIAYMQLLYDKVEITLHRCNPEDNGSLAAGMQHLFWNVSNDLQDAYDSSLPKGVAR